MKKLKVAIYARVSDDEETQSLNEQVEISKAQIINYCTKHNLEFTIVKILVEEAGLSGADKDRPKFNELCRLIENEEINAIAAKEKSRLCRCIETSTKILKIVRQHKTTLIVPGLEIDLNSSQGEFMYYLLSIVDQGELTKNAERTKSSIYSMAKTKGKVHGHSLPLGFRWDKEKKGRIIPVVSEIEQVRFIFETFTQVGSVRDTIYILNDKGIKTRKGKKYDRPTLLRILTNKKYISLYRLPCTDEEEYVQLDYPPQIDLALFDKAKLLIQEIDSKFKLNTRKIKRVHPLSGLVFTENNNPFHSTSGKNIRYYRSKVESISYRADELELAVKNTLLNTRENKELKNLLLARRKYIKRQRIPLEANIIQLTKELKKLRSKQTKIKDQLISENLTESLINILDNEAILILNETKSVEKNITELKERIVTNNEQSESIKVNIKNTYDAIEHTLNNATPEVLRGLYRKLLKRIVINTKKKTIHLYWNIKHADNFQLSHPAQFYSVNGHSKKIKERLFGTEGTEIKNYPIYKCYIIDKLSSIETAMRLQVKKTTVLKYLKQAGISRRKVGTNQKRKRGVTYGKKFLKHGREMKALSEIKRIEVMRKMKDSGMTYRAIANQLEELGIPTKTGRGKWHGKTVHAILHPPSTP